MADSKITALTANTTPATADLLVMVDDPSGAAATQKITLANFLKIIDALTADATPDTAVDYLVTYDASESAAKKVLLSNAVKVTETSTNTLTNKRITPRTGSTTSSATPTINTDNVDLYHLTAQTEAITSFTTNLSGTPTAWQPLFISVTGTAARAITWGSSFEAGPAALPTTTVTTQRLDVAFRWNSVTSKWRCMASGSS